MLFMSFNDSAIVARVIFSTHPSPRFETAFTAAGGADGLVAYDDGNATHVTVRITPKQMAAAEIRLLARFM
jgi:hypothetical protein